MKKSTYKRAMRKQKRAGLFALIAGTVCSILVHNWFIAMVIYPLAFILLTSKQLVWEAYKYEN